MLRQEGTTTAIIKRLKIKIGKTLGLKTPVDEGIHLALNKKDFSLLSSSIYNAKEIFIYWCNKKHTGISIKQDTDKYKIKAFKKLVVADSHSELFESRMKSIGPLADYIKTSYHSVYFSGVFFPGATLELIPPFFNGPDLQKELSAGSSLGLIFTVSTAEITVEKKNIEKTIQNLTDHVNELASVTQQQSILGFHIKLKDISDILLGEELDSTGIKNPSEEYHDSKEKERLLSILFHRSCDAIGWIVSSFLSRAIKKSEQFIKIQLPTSLPRKQKDSLIGYCVDSSVRINKEYPFYVDFNKIVLKHIGFYGSTGSGKSLAAQTIVESAHFRNIPVIVIDLSKQYTGFLKPCKDHNLLSCYSDFELSTPMSFPVKVFTPGSNVGVPMSANLLEAPEVDPEMKRIMAKESADVIANICELTNSERSKLEKYLGNKFKEGSKINLQDLENELMPYTSLADKLDRLKGYESILFSNKLDVNSLMKGINVIDISHLREDQIMSFVYAIARDIFSHFYPKPDSPDQLKCIVLFEEAHTYFSEPHIIDVISKGARTLRKKGCGLIFVSQIQTDIPPAIRGNINTHVLMRTNYSADLDRAKKKMGNYAGILPILTPGMGIIQNAEINSGQPFLVKFRPILHCKNALSDNEIKQSMNPAIKNQFSTLSQEEKCAFSDPDKDNSFAEKLTNDVFDYLAAHPVKNQEQITQTLHIHPKHVCAQAPVQPVIPEKTADFPRNPNIDWLHKQFTQSFYTNQKRRDLINE